MISIPNNNVLQVWQRATNNNQRTQPKSYPPSKKDSPDGSSELDFGAVWTTACGGLGLMNISQGSNVDIVVDFDWSEETIDVRSATVYDLDYQRIILSQTSPAIETDNIGKKVKVAYLVREKDEPARYCITGKLAEIVSDYKLPGSETAEALTIIRETGQEPFNLRLYYRLEPPTDSGIALFLNEEKVNIIDISIGGAKFTHRKDHPAKLKEIIKLILRVNGQSPDVKAQVVRIFPVSGRMAKRLETVAVQFLNLDRKMKELLSRKIRDIEREMRYRELYLEG